MFNLKQAKKLHLDLQLIEDEIKSLKHTLRYSELSEYEFEIFDEMYGIAQQQKKQAEKDLMDFYIDHVEMNEILIQLVA